MFHTRLCCLYHVHVLRRGFGVPPVYLISLRLENIVNSADNNVEESYTVNDGSYVTEYYSCTDSEFWHPESQVGIPQQRITYLVSTALDPHHYVRHIPYGDCRQR